MSLMNRKMFNRNARNKLNAMGGIRTLANGGLTMGTNPRTKFNPNLVNQLVTPSLSFGQISDQYMKGIRGQGPLANKFLTPIGQLDVDAADTRLGKYGRQLANIGLSGLENLRTATGIASAFTDPSGNIIGDFLKQPTKKERENSSEIKVDEETLEKILLDFGVEGKINKISNGPVVTLNEFEPAPGVKVSKIINLSEDIARNTSSESARIATIPGSSSIGIELPKSSRENVYLSEIISSNEFSKKNIKLPIALGKSISGMPITGDLSAMPHLLIAGTTGSGKSVCINTIILSLLYRHSPDKCKFILIDPKMLELSTYEGIPHLLCPVITEAKRAASVLGWVVKEMESRYRLMTREGVRNIDGYNDKHKLSMPYIVVIVDEMSDLMLVAGKEIENYIQKLSQMARAAGIHIIMATQRPSVDVITGTIKANFPTRISFQVTSKIDSRTILGEQGAEQLLGKGDMLYMSSANRIVRIHAPFVSENEIEKINNFLRNQAEPDYVDEILNFADEKDTKSSNKDDENLDELYETALEIIKSERKASTSFLQRKLQIGYNRAARIIDQMESNGEVSKANHVGKREVLK